jgi:2'-5' RNA ligase
MANNNKKRKQNRHPRAYPENHSFRLFIAVEVPAEAVEKLIFWQNEYLASDPVLRMTPAGQLHITLTFIGPVGDRERELAFTQLDQLSRRDSFEAVLPSLVGLPKGRHPRVVAAKVEEPGGTLDAIHDELAAGLMEKGIYKRKKRPYLPHITIARARGRTGIDLAAINPEPIQFTAVRVTLYNSVLKASGALHRALKSVQLT